MSHKKTLDLFKTGKYHEAINVWKDLLEENVLSEKNISDIKKASDYIANLDAGDSLKSELSGYLDILSGFYRVSPGVSFRAKKEDSQNGPPAHIQIHPDGRLLIADEINHRVQFFSKNGDYLSSFGEKGSQPGQFQYPKGILCGTSGSIYVADAWNHRIQEFDTDGAFVREFGVYGDDFFQFNEPHGITRLGNGWIYILDRCNHRVQVFTEDFKFVGSFGNRGTAMEEDMAYLFSTPAEKFCLPAFEFPTAIDSDSNDNLYIADCNNHRIQKFNRYGHKVDEWGGKGSSKGEFMYPQAISIDGANNIFVADMNNNRIQRFNTNGEFIYSIAMPGNEANSMTVPVALKCEAGRLYVGFGFHPEIRVFDYQPEIPDGLRNIEKKFEDRGQRKKDFSHLVLKAGLAFDELKRGKFPEEQISLVERLEAIADSLEEEIVGMKGEWIQAADPLISAVEKRALMVLEEKDSNNVEFDENLYQLEKKNMDLERKLKMKLTHYKRAYENIYKIQSFVFFKADKGDAEGLRPFFDSWFSRTKNLAALLANLLSEREGIFENMKTPHELFLNDPKGARVEFKKGSHMLAVYPLIASQLYLVLEIAISALKDWIVFLKKNGMENAEGKNLFQEIFSGGLGECLETVLQKSEHDHRIFDAISKGAQMLAASFVFKDAEQSEWVSLFLGEVIKSEKKILPPLLTSTFLGTMGVSRFKVELDNYLDGEGHDLKEFLSSDSSGNGELFGEAECPVVSLRELMKKEMDIILQRMEGVMILKSAASYDEKVQLSQNDRLLSLEFNEWLNDSTITRLLSGNKGNLIRLLSRLFYCLNNKETERISEINSNLRKNNDKYRVLLEELREFQIESQEDLKQVKAKLSSGSGKESDFSVKKELEKKRMTLDETLVFLKNIVGKYSDLLVFNECVTELAQEMDTVHRAPKMGKQIKWTCGLPIGNQGSLLGNLNLPCSIQINKHNELIVSNSGSIKMFTIDGVPIGEMKGYGTMPANFKNPVSATVDADENTYILEFATVSESSNIRVQKITPSGETLSLIGGVGSDELKKPTDILVDNQNQLWISDFIKNEILIYSRDGQLIKSIGKEGNGPGEFNGPWGLTQMDNGDIAVSESLNHRIQIFDSEGNHKMFCIAENVEMENVYRLAKGPNGTLLASDFTRHCIYVFNEEYKIVSSFGGYGQSCGKFNGPLGMLCVNQTLFVCDGFNHRIQCFNESKLL